MLQFYFLSIVGNFVAGVSLSSDWIARRIPTLAALMTALSGRSAKLSGGLAALLVGVGTLFVPVEGPLIIGDLFPSVAGMAMGIALLFEVFKQDAVLPVERSEKTENFRLATERPSGSWGS